MARHGFLSTDEAAAIERRARDTLAQRRIGGMTRMPYPESANVTPDVRALLDSRPPRNVFRMLAHAPALLPGVMELTGAILYKAKLDPLSRELAILRVGHLCGSAYEILQHEKIGQAVGLAPEKIAGTARDADATLYDARELLVLRMAEQVVRKVRADDDLFAATVAAFGHEQTMELLITIGSYVMLAQVLENAAVEPESGGGPSQQDVQRIFGHQGAAR
jgi:4-carboxymuconolactone decarboxylase